MLRSGLLLSRTLRLKPSRRGFSSSAFGDRTNFSSNGAARRVGAIAITGALGTTAYLSLRKPVRADAASGGESSSSGSHQTPLSVLLRSYLVFSMCAIPTLVDHSPAILATFSSIPGLKQVAESFVRATFFAQFVGGESAAGTVPVLASMRAENKGTLFAYSVEVNEDEAAGTGKTSVRGHVADPDGVIPPHKQAVEEMIRCIDVAADFEDGLRAGAGIPTKKVKGRRTWVAIKLTALVPDARALVRFSSHLVKSRQPFLSSISFPGCPQPSDLDVLYTRDPLTLPPLCPLTNEDLTSLKELKADLFRICQRAKERGVKVIVDAEYSWFQPAIDALQLDMMREFNRLPSHKYSLLQTLGIVGKKSAIEQSKIELVQPLVYGTFQAYLRRNEAFLAQSIADARAGGYALGAKLVRGAYHSLEAAAHTQALHESLSGAAITSPAISPDSEAPVWTSKYETDTCYERCALMLLSAIEKDVKKGEAAPPAVGALFGTHNPGSCDLVLNELVKRGIATQEQEEDRKVVKIADDVAERVTIGQLYGMNDSLSDSLVARVRTSDPFVVKYVPYGALTEVMPYLGRRATENKSVLGNGQAEEERKKAGAEIMRRVRSLLSW